MTTDHNCILRRAVRIAILSASTLATGWVTNTSIAQTSTPPDKEQTDSTPPLTEVVVTGSRVPTPIEPGLVSITSTVTVIYATK